MARAKFLPDSNKKQQLVDLGVMTITTKFPLISQSLLMAEGDEFIQVVIPEFIAWAKQNKKVPKELENFNIEEDNPVLAIYKIR